MPTDEGSKEYLGRVFGKVEDAHRRARPKVESSDDFKRLLVDRDGLVGRDVIASGLEYVLRCGEDLKQQQEDLRRQIDDYGRWIWGMRAVVAVGVLLFPVLGAVFWSIKSELDGKVDNTTRLEMLVGINDRIAALQADIDRRSAERTRQIQAMDHRMDVIDAHIDRAEMRINALIEQLRPH